MTMHAPASLYERCTAFIKQDAQCSPGLGASRRRCWTLSEFSTRSANYTNRSRINEPLSNVDKSVNVARIDECVEKRANALLRKTMAAIRNSLPALRVYSYTLCILYKKKIFFSAASEFRNAADVRDARAADCTFLRNTATRVSIVMYQGLLFRNFSYL